MTEPFDVDTTPSPEEVRRVFARLLKDDAHAATRYLYELGLSNGYIRAEDIARNVRWSSESPFGTLEMSINLAKPEKDPRAITRAAEAVGVVEESNDSGTAPAPLCDLCWENEGFAGSPEYPAKPGLRIAAIELGGETWGLQYSPYAYFPEHCIALSKQHRPMKIDAATIDRLLDFVDLFPFYFLGSNADLPIVGGSILGHDHFQGGLHAFPLMEAPVERRLMLTADDYCVEAGIVAWPASVIRLRSDNRAAIAAVAARVIRCWQVYDDEACGIRSYTVAADGSRVLHNTLNPIMHKDGSIYVADLVLRNNQTDVSRPWGIFHPDEALHHIKKENIGLIEIMGLAILPPRLAQELPAVQAALYEAAVGGNACLPALLMSNPETAGHARWAMEVLQRRRGELAEEASAVKDSVEPGGIRTVMRTELAEVFVKILEATGVFKRNAAGTDGWERFLARL